MEKIDVIEKAIEILMEEKGYFFCSECDDWVQDISPKEHKELRHNW